MGIDVNVGILPKFHEIDGSCIVNGGHLSYWIQVEHHDAGKTSQIWWESSCVETSPFSNTTNMGLNHLYGEHSILEVSEVMFYISKSKNFINVLHFNGEFMASYLTIYNIIWQDGINIELLNQWLTNPCQITKKPAPTSFCKATRDKVVPEIGKLHKPLLNDWSFHKVLGVSLKMLGGAKQRRIHAIPFSSTLSGGFPWSHMQNRAAKTTKQSTKYENKLNQ